MRAEEMAEILMKEYKLSAFLHDRGSKQRLEEQGRIDEMRRKYDEMLNQLKGQGVEPEGKFRVRTYYNQIEDEFAVLIGRPGTSFKDMDSARDFLDKVRKLKPPADRFSTKAVFAEDDPTGKKVNQKGYGFINPFQTAFVIHNPTIPLQKQQDDPEVADAFLKELNANNEYNVLKCSKPWTLVVKVYQGQTLMQSPKSPSIMQRLGLSKKEPDILNANGAQAMATCEFLRKMKPSFDAYVLHHRSYSLVTVGQYDAPNDPNLVAAQRTLANLQLKTQKDGVALETLSAQPLPMKIPR